MKEGHIRAALAGALLAEVLYNIHISLTSGTLSPLGAFLLWETTVITKTLYCNLKEGGNNS